MGALWNIFAVFLLYSGNARGDLKFEKELQVALDVNEVKKSPYYKDQVLKIPISNDAGKELFQHWTDQAFSGLISAIATRRMRLVEEYDKEKHEECAKNAHDVPSHAKCLVELEKDGMNSRLLKRRQYFGKKMRRKIDKSMENSGKRRRFYSKEIADDWVGSFRTARAKREIRIKNQSSYELKSDSDRTPFGIITKHLSNTVKILKKKDRLSKWQTIIERIKDESSRLKKKKEAENIARKRVRVFQNAAKRIKMNDSMEISNNRRALADPDSKRFASMEKYIEDEEVREMFHQKTSNMTNEEKMMMIPMDIIRQVAKLGLSLGGQNVTDFDKKTVKLISPRFMSVLPDDEQEKSNVVDFLSPSLFSLHDDGTDVEKNTSLKSLLGNTMDSYDSQQFLDLLVEATGVAEAVEDAEVKMIDAQRKKDDAMGRGPDGQPLYFTKENVTDRFPSEARKIEIFEKLDKTYSVDQLKEMNQTGYTILSPKQMELVYGRKSPFRNPKLIRQYKNMTRGEITRSIHGAIKGLSEEKLKFEVRQKDIVLSPIVATSIINNPTLTSQAIILSPLLMVPIIQSPAIFGSVIISPWVFLPLILSPRILSPVVLTPFLFAPMILSPLALDPVILSPGVMNPFVLSPLLMCPFIMSPQVMTPLILSPFALNPLILNPLLMSPLVLSPFVLSPQVLSPQFVTGIILSPYALSPAIQSNGAMVTVFASPSWLST